MNNYKIIENRPELTASQVIAGMNFALVKTNAIAAKTTLIESVIGKGIIVKGIIVVIGLASVVTIYNKYNRNNEPQQKQIPVFDTLMQTDSFHNNPVIMDKSAHVLNTMLKPITQPYPVCQPRQITSTPNIPQIIPAKDSMK
jgi:hypothetical protein